jgi:protein-arginine kinase activator protein McsA
MQVCVHCGWTVGEFHARRLLGCPHCYENLGDALLGELLVMHPDLHAATWPPSQDLGPSNHADQQSEQIAQWREQLGDALRREDYTEAARFKALIVVWEKRHGRV